MSDQSASDAAPGQATPQHFAALWADDDREPLPLVGSEREILTRSLDWYRDTLVLKCSGLTPQELSKRSVPPSGMSLHGLLRHLAGVERWWFRIQLGGEEAPMLYYSNEDPEQDFDRLDGDPAEVLAVWRRECERSREIVAAMDLDATGVHKRTGDPVSVRRVLVWMIAEYARHGGHADLLRERIDGATGH
ncbi:MULTISPECIES: DinB family protein [unclassified Streptomyces]|uniref:DinB family protein n=1 Tax=unclassified Streptomyces TaxID=2593676 RepID=UPI002DDC4745|nr:MULTISPECIES: DinB family protein [unclassified Streptomyces]WSB77306.1 DinB family protein [Streptomyces sp. NBC_01775]WSS14429.1 DinB family protein [Streptomyces sp. NBC_01186]WSS43246.1 DinB family protein [Streptomyces sp. NBC_01187]